MKKVLNVGGNTKEIPLPPEYVGFEHLLLDIDPRGSPDILCDARQLATLKPAQFDAVYCSHNLEHYYRHDVQIVLSGFLHVLKEGGIAHIRVPDIHDVMRITLERNLDIDDILYQSPAGPIMVLDVLYGYAAEIEQSGQDFYAHKTGFTRKSLSSALLKAGFSVVYTELGNYEITALAFKGTPDQTICTLFGISHDSTRISQLEDDRDNQNSPAETDHRFSKVELSGKSVTLRAPNNTNQKYQDWLALRNFIQTDIKFLNSESSNDQPPPPIFHLLIRLPAGSETQLADTLDSLGQQIHVGWHLDVISTLPAPDAVEDIPNIGWHTLENNLEFHTTVELLAKTSPCSWLIEIPPGARLDALYLWRLAKEIFNFPNFQAFFVDDDCCDSHGNRHSPRFKPGANPARLRSSDLAGPLCVRKDSWIENDRINDQNGSPWFSQLLAITRKFGWQAIKHIPDVLITYPDRFPTQIEPCITALIEDFSISATPSDIIPVSGQSWNIRTQLSTPPVVSIAILSSGQLDLLSRCFCSIIDKTNYPEFEILLVVDADCSDPDLENWLAKLPTQFSRRILPIRPGSPCNHASRSNAAIENANSEWVVLMREEAVIIQINWLRELVSACMEKNIVGAAPRLISPGNALIQNAGNVLGLTGLIGSPYESNAKLSDPGYLDCLQIARDVSTLPAACMIVSKTAYQEVDGMDANDLGEHFAEVDLCQKLRRDNQRLIFQPLATVVYDGSAELKIAGDAERQSRLMLDKSHATRTLVGRWGENSMVDPYWNPNLSLLSNAPIPETDYRAQWQYLPTSAPRFMARPLPNGQGIFRITSPLRALRKAGQAAECVWPQQGQHEPTTSEVMRLKPDTLIVQHYLSDSKLAMLESLHATPGRPFIVFSIDDLLTNMAASNPLRKYVPSNSRTRLRYALERCDRMLASTDFLAEAYRHFIPDIKVVPNRLEQDIWQPLQSHKRTGKKPRIGWAGGTTHLGDLTLLKSVIEKTRHEADWVFFGMCPDEIRPLLSEYHAFGELAAYPGRLAALNLDIAVAPLEQIPFNQGKSNLRLLEYGILGIPVVCTEIDPYQGSPACCVANTTEAWVAALRERIHDADAREREGAVIQHWVRRNYLLENHLDDWLNAHLPE